MRKVKINKSYNRDFNSFEEVTYCYIHIENEEIRVKLKRDGTKLNMSFTFKNQIYHSKELICTGHEYYVGASDIEFENIILHEIDKDNIGECINRMFDYLYD